MGKYRFLFFGLFAANALAGQVMYPGDTNNDGVANYLDLLPVGIGYGVPGEERPAASENWFAQPFIIWDYFLPTTGINGGLINANGDGTIDSLDIDAIAANYDMMQDTAMPLPWQHNIVCASCPPPVLSISYDQDSVAVNGAFQATISVLYPEPVPPLLGALGLALDLTYDPDLVVETSVTVAPNTDEGTMMFITATSQEAAGFRLPPPGRVHVSAAGRGQNVFFNDSTMVARVEFIVVDDIQRDTAFRAFKLEIANLLFLNLKEELLFPIIHNPDSVVLYQPLDGLEEPPLRALMKVFPNPARGEIFVQASQPVELSLLRLWNAQGELSAEAAPGMGTEWTIPAGRLAPGLYLLEIQRGREKWVERVLIQ